MAFLPTDPRSKMLSQAQFKLYRTQDAGAALGERLMGDPRMHPEIRYDLEHRDD